MLEIKYLEKPTQQVDIVKEETDKISFINDIFGFILTRNLEGSKKHFRQKH